MKKLFKTIDGRNIIHQHLNRIGTTRFMPCNKNDDIDLWNYTPVIDKKNNSINWNNPFTKEEMKHLSKPF